MSLTINRDDIRKGIGDPNGVIDADFIGQYYIETNENKVYIATSMGSDGWKKTLLAGDSITVRELGDTIDIVKKEVVDRIGTDFLLQPALQVGLKGGTIDINSDTYIKGNLYLWDASYQKNPDKTWNYLNTSVYTIKSGYTFEMSDQLGSDYHLDSNRCVIRIKLPYDDNTVVSNFTATARVKNANGSNKITFRLIGDSNYIAAKKEFFTVNEEEGEVFAFEFGGFQRAKYLEIATNKVFENTAILSMANPKDSDKVWTQRNWSPSLIIKNADEVDRMEVNESRFMLIQKSENLDLQAGKNEPVPPLNGMYFKNIGTAPIKTQYNVNGSTGQLEVGKIYQFSNGNWRGPISESEVPKRIKPELAIPQRGEGGQLIAPSTETDNADLQMAIGGLHGAQTKDPIIANKALDEHSGWGKGGAFHSWIYSAQTVEYRLSALKNICTGYTDTIKQDIDGQLDQVNKGIKQQVAEAVRRFSETDGNSFSKIDIQQGNSGNLDLTMTGNTGVLDISPNEQLEKSQLHIGFQNQIEEIHINAKKLFFTGEIVNKNARQEVALPPIKTSTSGQSYINSPTTSPALDLNHGAIARATQLVFDNAPDTPIGIFFPKITGGSGRYTGSYNYITVRDGELRTNTVLTSSLNYIKLDNRRIFFTPTAPTMAEEGDIWIEI